MSRWAERALLAFFVVECAVVVGLLSLDLLGLMRLPAPARQAFIVAFAGLCVGWTAWLLVCLFRGP